MSESTAMTINQQRLANLVHAAFRAGYRAGQQDDIGTDGEAAFQSWQDDADVIGVICALAPDVSDGWAAIESGSIERAEHLSRHQVQS